MGDPQSGQAFTAISKCPRAVVMAAGTVKWFSADKGFGLITPDDGGVDVFAHLSAVQSGGFRSLEQSQRTSFDVEGGAKGPQAANIQAI